MFANAITVSIIGMGEGMLEEILQQSKSRVSLTWGPASSDPHLLSAIGQAASDLSASRAQLLQNIGAMYEVVRNGEPISMGLRRRCRRDQVAGSRRAIEAIDACYDRAGAGAISMSSPLQRFWKDAHTGRHHTINSIEHSFANWALTEMGFDSTDVMI
jgi:3-hydroxy-9,10-secoandrosta-1,3,5(10)-triene-9,17-dione monooxygenase